ncbi:MAG: hypothetical protein MUC83_15565 [Pirellula sp.]|nr:hypothetical protein [Pirellula sp.]
MAKDERKRQKTLAKKKKREMQVRKEANKVRNPTPQDLAKAMQRGSWYACYEIGEDIGLNNIICVRNSPMGPVGCAFLVDRYCLGIKSVQVMKSVDLARLSDYVKDRNGRIVTPAYASKLIKFCIDEAEKIGFAPHRMTATMLPIFFDVDVTECTETFEFGRDGKPTYIAGPFESDVQQMEILNTLSKLGGTNFNFVASINAEGFRSLKSFRAYDDDSDVDEYEDDFEAEHEESNTIDSTATVIDVPSKE